MTTESRSDPTINLTPTPEGQETILAAFADSVLNDVRKARRDADVELLRGIVALAFTFGFNAKALSATEAVAQRERLEDLVR